MDKSIKDSIEKIFTHIGDDPTREGLVETPERMVRSWDHLFSGYKQNAENVFKTFTAENKNGSESIVSLDNIEFYSTCEHHFLPFFGEIAIGYIPDKKILGVSKLSRLVEVYSRRLQIQERLVEQIADDLMEHLAPKGCIVHCRAQHLCMMTRGVEKKDAFMTTITTRGVFNEIDRQSLFLSMIK